MKKTTILLCLLLGALLLAPSAASAAEFSLMGSYWDTEDFGEAGGVGARVSWKFGRNSMLDLTAHYLEELNEDFDLADFDDDTERGQVFEAGLEIIPIDLGLRFGPGGFYFGLGVSYYFLDSSFENIEYDDAIGYYGLIGLELGPERGARFFAEVLYRTTEDGIDFQFIDVEGNVDLDLSGFSANAGVSFNFGGR